MKNNSTNDNFYTLFGFGVKLYNNGFYKASATCFNLVSCYADNIQDTKLKSGSEYYLRLIAMEEVETIIDKGDIHLYNEELFRAKYYYEKALETLTSSFCLSPLLEDTPHAQDLISIINKQIEKTNISIEKHKRFWIEWLNDNPEEALKQLQDENNEKDN